MFDRAYQIVCRDAASPVGSMLVLRADNKTSLSAVLAEQSSQLQCTEPKNAAIDNLSSVMAIECVEKEQSIDRLIYVAQRGKDIFLVEGLKGYDSALRLALAALLTDQPVSGTVDVATTSLSDPAAFARIRAGQLSAAAARNQAYTLNNSGNFSEASEFFETLLGKEESASLRSAELLANQGLQQSNLGGFPAAEAMFDRADKMVARSDGVTQRLIRNFRAIHHINQGQFDKALTALDRSVAPPADDRIDGEIASGVIAEQMARQINRENNDLKLLGAVGTGLTEDERAKILDGQALQIRGTALRSKGDYEKASQALTSSLTSLTAVRNGRVASVAWLLMEARYELGLIAEARGDIPGATQAFESSVQFAEVTYPQSPALLTAKARLAAHMARQGRADEAIALFDTIVAESEVIPSAASSMKDLLAPYFGILGTRITDQDVGPKLYRAAQLLQRPGVAQTQAIFARELSEGSDEAAALFRLTVSRTRSIARTSADIARLAALADRSPAGEMALIEARENLVTLQKEQTALQSRLADFSQYRVLSSGRLTLEELQKILKPGEAYYKVSIVGESVYAQLMLPSDIRSSLLSVTSAELDDLVAGLRDSVVVYENGRPVTYPFDVEKARTLYSILFDGFGDVFQSVEHLVYEPDGALLQLPPTLLISDQQGVDDYLERTEEIDADAFDFTEIKWLGREKSVSIAVSQRAFFDIRKIASSRSKKQYLGLGQNAKPAASLYAASESTAENCDWPLSNWQNPIAADELYTAQKMLGEGLSDVVTGAAFSDTALLQNDQLSNYRIVHFATHGLVTAPRPQCIPRPALLTSFGGDGSDGLLSFKEIFDLRLDADLVILSACDTAGLATIAASREAGISTGGNYALDGLVRAFVGAGARSVLASHWPVPDDYDATNRLISGIFTANKSSTIGTSLADTQRILMDDPLTSHPYYWAAFILVGDGAKKVIR